MVQLYSYLILILLFCSNAYADPLASRIRTDVSAFNGGLSAADTDVQKAKLYRICV